MKVAKSDWQTVVLVCGKCSRKVDGGFGPKGTTPLAKILRKLAGKGRKARAGVIESRCLKLCPKNAVTIVDARRPHEWLVVAPGEPVEALVERLGLTDLKSSPGTGRWRVAPEGGSSGARPPPSALRAHSSPYRGGVS